MQNVSLLAAIKNNLDYTQNFYKTTRDLYPETEICFVSYGSIDGTHEWLESLKTIDPNVQIFYSDEIRCFADTYNKAAQLSTKDYIVFVHNDMVLCSGFLENLSKHLSPNNIVSYTTVEPPIFEHHQRPGKLICDCGSDLNSFDQDKFNNYTTAALSSYKDQTQDGIVFFMGLFKQIFLDIGGFDNLFNPFFREDDDLIKRLKMLKDKNYFTALDSLCYHFISKTSRFSKEYASVTRDIELNSTRNYLRKWGSISYDNTHNISFLLKNCSLEVLELLEPYAQNIYIKSDIDNIIERYIYNEQDKTKISLQHKLHDSSSFKENVPGVYCAIDCNNINRNDIELITNLPYVIKKINKIGTHKINNITLFINDLNTIQESKICNG